MKKPVEHPEFSSVRKPERTEEIKVNELSSYRLSRHNKLIRRGSDAKAGDLVFRSTNGGFFSCCSAEVRSHQSEWPKQL